MADPRQRRCEPVSRRPGAAVPAAVVPAGGEALTRRAATALYAFTAAVAMLWEAGRLGSPERRYLADLTLAHRLLPGDPLAPQPGVSPEAEGVLLDRSAP